MESLTPQFKPSFTSIQHPSVVEQIIETFKQSLIRGQLKPGQKLPSELELSQQLGVGRSAVREAMKVMQALGVITIRQGDGTYVVDEPSPTLLSPLVFAVMLESGMNLELFELRYMVQVGYTELAAQNATENDMELMKTAAKQLEDQVEKSKDDVELMTHLDLGFHFAVLDATHNPLVIKIGRTVEELFFSTIQSALLSNIDFALDSHRKIINAIYSKDPQHIREAIDYSLIRWKEEVQQLREQKQAQQPE